MIRSLVGPVTNLAQVGGLVSLYTGHASLAKVMIRDRDKRLRFFTQTVGQYSKRALNAMNFQIDVVGRDEELMQKKNFLLVGNHMSYVDILVLASVQPSVFVTSVDMGEVFFLGTMAELGGSIFIERRHRGQVERDIKVMSETLRSGHNVVIYPEGTSTDGQRILPFKKSLLMSAVEAGVDILPVVTKYVEINGEPFDTRNCDKICWYGDMSFAPHFMGLTRLKNVRAELHFLDPIPVTPESSRHDLAERAYRAINACYFSSGEPPGESSVESSFDSSNVLKAAEI